MPIYEYRRPDGSTFDVMQPFSEEPLTHDPETGVRVERVLHAPAVHFKGKGFYNTDYGTRKRQREGAAAGEGAASEPSPNGGSPGDSNGAGQGAKREGGSSSERGSSGEGASKSGGSKGEGGSSSERASKSGGSKRAGESASKTPASAG
jgi:putative FmdB family regulatory protein